ncbi:Ppx/GppA phosphatase family protein [Pseudochelatococcus lubricantis]|nr:Ppx/GppA phosphatase family protein [Pseudochelatococcus lubricantis]
MAEPSGVGARTTREPGPRLASRQREAARTYAALDLGTNNCRLLVAEPTYDSFRVVDAFSRIVRLGEGLTSVNRLGEDAISRAIEALKVCRAKMDARRVGRARMIATEACRAAANGQDFIDRVEDETGLMLEIVNRETEALLAVSGCTGLADPAAESVLVFDIGGGSTELVWTCARKHAGRGNGRTQGAQGRGRHHGGASRQNGHHGRDDSGHCVRAWESLPMGVVTLAERYGGVEVTPAVFAAMVREVERHLAPFAWRARDASRMKGFHLLGTSGTVTTIAGVHLDLPRYDRRQVDGLWMKDRDVSEAIAHLLNCSYAQRVANPCIGNDRADLVLAGCAILEAIRRAFPSPRLRVADRGLREGILLNMMREDNVWDRGPKA